ncbi:MAG: hypothetical protein HWD92_01460 [Flavobacteriia bacterium]|nr:hypothetical protein [Flavobacteriia bacterium]
MSNVCLAQDDSLQFTQYLYDNGTVASEGYLENGQPEGYWKSYYPSGILKSEGNREDHLLEGEWKFYTDSGTIANVIRYSAGKKEGLSETYRDSVVVAAEPFVNNRRSGLAKYFYPDGSIERWVPFVDGREEGKGYHFTPEGTVDAILTFQAGVLTREQEINRTNRLGLKQGLWVDFHRNMQPRVEGTYRDDLKHGYWKYYQRNGNLIRIEHWILGVLQEGDDQTTKMEVRRTIHPSTGEIATIGAYQDGEREGVHQQFDEDGNPISSQLFRDDILLAEGMYDDRGRRQGEWKYYYPDGTLKAIGDYADDLRMNQWKYYYEDSTLEQEGRYYYDAPDGTWRWYFENGELRKEQQFRDGLENGPVVEYNDSNEVIVRGQYIDGLESGIWEYTSHNVIETGEFIQGERQGRWEIRWIDIDRVSEVTNWIDGVMDGQYIRYFEDGSVRIRGKYVDGNKDGVWEHFASNGARIVTVEYNMGEEVKYNGARLRNF